LSTYPGKVHSFRPGRYIRQERPRIEECRIVRVILEGDEIEPCLLAALGELDHVVRSAALRDEEGPEEEFVAVVGHGCSFLRAGPPGTGGAAA
jgi:hypothetical protein